VNKLVLCGAAAIRKERLNSRQKLSQFLAKHAPKIISKNPIYPLFEKLLIG